MSTLVPCPTCARHVRPGACVFCGADASTTLPHPARPVSRRAFTRAAIAFGAAAEPWAGEASVIDAYYKLDINDYRGVDTLQLVIEYAEAVA